MAISHRNQFSPKPKSTSSPESNEDLSSTAISSACVESEACLMKSIRLLFLFPVLAEDELRRTRKTMSAIRGMNAKAESKP